MNLTEAQKLLINKLGQDGLAVTSLSIEERQEAELLGKFGAVILRWKGLGENRYAATPQGLAAVAGNNLPTVAEALSSIAPTVDGKGRERYHFIVGRDARDAIIAALGGPGTMSAPALRVESPDLHAQFAAMSPETPLPWDADPGMPGFVFDANGDEVCSLPTEDARAAEMIVVAVNTCGGFRAEPAK